jgi:hypothetical protein
MWPSQPVAPIYQERSGPFFSFETLSHPSPLFVHPARPLIHSNIL